MAQRLLRPSLVAGLIVLLLLAGAISFLTVNWPFTEERVLLSLARATKSDVQTEQFRTTFFPQPGCILVRPAFTRAPGPALATADRIEIRTSWFNIVSFRRRISLLRAVGLRVHIPLPPPPPRDHGVMEHRVTVGNLIADGAIVEFRKSGREKPLGFALHKLLLTDVGRQKPVGFSTVADIPHPPGRLTATGRIGPFDGTSFAMTAASGQFELENANLAIYDSLQGGLNGTGQFEGSLGGLRVTANTSVDGFAMRNNGRPVNLRSQFRALVDGTTGDVVLESVEVNFLQTRLSASGAIRSSRANGGKIVALDFRARQARIEDLAQLATRTGDSPIAGTMPFRARVRFPAGARPFLRHVALTGTFDIENAVWRRTATQRKVDDLSARARGDKEQTESGKVAPKVRTDLQGSVEIRDGTAVLSSLSMRVPGAVATGGGTYHLATTRVNLRGKVAMEASLSEATSGFKSLLVKPFNFLFRRKGQRRGSTVPFRITGTSSSPAYHVGPGS